MTSIHVQSSATFNLLFLKLSTCGPLQTFIWRPGDTLQHKPDLLGDFPHVHDVLLRVKRLLDPEFHKDKEPPNTRDISCLKRAKPMETNFNDSNSVFPCRSNHFQEREDDTISQSFSLDEKDLVDELVSEERITRFKTNEMTKRAQKMIQPPDGDKAPEKQELEERITQAKAKELSREVRAMLIEEEEGVAARSISIPG
ncbi:unnamed protein product [Cochlearia groenlandica]